MAETRTHEGSLQATRWALLLGNFFIGCGVMVINGTLNNLVHDLGITVAQGGHLIAVGGVMMGVGAPVLASLFTRVDRRWLLALAMIWYAVGHLLCALATGYEGLLPVRALTVLSAAVFTPQAAAAMGFLAPPNQRARAITFVFLGWALASVMGVPITSWIGERLGWRAAMGMISAGALLSAVLVLWHMPKSVRPPALTMQSWLRVARSPLLIAVVLVSCFQSAGQTTVMAFIAPYLKEVHQASPEQISLAFAFFGAMAFIGNVILNQVIHRISPGQAVSITLGLIVFSMALWPLAGSLGTLLLVFMPWSLSGFATNAAQQARLGALSPTLAPALMALNTSAIYSGHALGAGGGSWLIAHFGNFDKLHWVSMAWVSAALLLSLWAGRVQRMVARQ